jgi:HEAT repeat protein
MRRAEVEKALASIRAGEPREAIEAAKRLIGARVNVRNELTEIARLKAYPRWARIAAIYCLGFLTGSRTSRALTSVLGDQTENYLVREHAAEALGNLRAKFAVPLLSSLIFSPERSVLKKSCIYALSQIANREARAALEKFADTKPTGVIDKELKSALRELRKDGKN